MIPRALRTSNRTQL